MRYLLMPVLLFALISCDSQKANNNVAIQADAKDLSGLWRMELQLPDNVLPVNLHIAEDESAAWFINGAERVPVPEFIVKDTQLQLRFPTFNNGFQLNVHNNQLEGELTLVKRGYVQHIPVTGVRGQTHRFSAKPMAAEDFTGRWEVLFTEDDGKEYPAVAELDQQGSQITGTFLTPTGDYRYLQGDVDGQQLSLSTFDGSHAFLFRAELSEAGQLEGHFWSGTHWHESWVAHRNFDAKLPDAYSLTFLKEGYDTLDFRFPDLEGKPVSLIDTEYQGKVVLVTLSGTWCPNCADEVAFLSKYFDENRERGLEIITLLYEHVEGFDAAAQQGRALRDEYGIEYKLLVAGSSDKTLASETLPMLNHVMAFPTMIFIDRSGQVRRIHTGFSGPGTGAYYTEFLAEFEQEMNELLDETGLELFRPRE